LLANDSTLDQDESFYNGSANRINNSNTHGSFFSEDIRPVNEIRPSYGSIDTARKSMDEDAAVSPKFQSKKQPIIITVVRSTAERLRLAGELIFTSLQVVILALAYFIPSINGEWLAVEGDKSVLIALLVFWVYALALVIARLFFIRSSFIPNVGLWTHSTVLYLAAWLFTLPNLRSALINPYSPSSRNLYIFQFTFATILFISNFSARLGDKPAYLYTTEGLEPSVEPIASLFSLVTYSWIDPMVWKGYFYGLNTKDVWELREDDHTASVLRDFRKINPAYGLARRMLIYFRKSLFVSGSWAFIYSFVTFGPPFLMKQILEYVEDPSRAPANLIWLYVIGMFLFGILDNIVSGQSLYIGRRMCIRMRSIIIGEVYAKALRRRTGASKEKKLGKKDDDSSSSDEETTPSNNKDESKSNDKGQSNQGAIINLMAVDAFKVSEICGYLHYFVGGILVIAFAIAFLYTILGWSAFVGAIGMFLLMPVNYYVSSLFARFQNDLMATTDDRVNKLNELLQNIRIVKYFVWEEKFADGVKTVRSKELAILKKRYILWSCAAGLWFISPILITLISFSTYILIQNRTLTAPVAFTSLALFNIMRAPMDQLADMLNNVLQSKVSIDRVEEFLNEAETSKYEQLGNPTRGPNSPVIGFEKATFSWESSDASNTSKADFKLRDINIDFKIGELNVVIGPTGAGKTSLLLALLGEMELTEGRVFLPSAMNRDDVTPNPQTGLAETVAYCAQQAWLLNDTLRNNILFGNEFNEARYNAVVEACALKRDLEILDAGDQTEIGEKGITLSGGQKQRVSLARAIYSNSKHLLLDDCLSAVDSHTALWIYEKCLTGPLCSGRTTILVSHNVALTISQAAFVVAMENGRVVGQGLPYELASRGLLGSDELVSSAAQSNSVTRVQSSENLEEQGNAPSASDLKMEISKLTKDSKSDITENDNDNEEIRKKTDGKLVKEETKSEGHVDSKVYIGYITAMGGFWFWLTIFVVYLGAQGLNVFQSWWIKVWTAEMNGLSGAFIVSLQSKTGTYQLADRLQSFTFTNSFSSLSNATQTLTALKSEPIAEHSPVYYIVVYALIGVAYTFVGMYKDLISYLGGVHASEKIFNDMLDSVLRSKIRFFDATPIGRIMNRFSKDIEAVDQDLAPVATGVAHCALAALATTLLIAFITPGFLVAGVFIAAMYWAIGVFYLASSRDLKRIDSITKSPVYQHFGETLSGVSTIRAYGVGEKFAADNLTKIDDNNRPFFYMWVANRWLSFRIDFTGAFVSFSAASMVMLSLGHIDAGLAGLSLSYAISFSENVLWIVRLYAILEMNMNSVERIQEYMEVEKEAPAIIADFRPPIDWPSKGVIEIDNLSLRYAPELPRVIKNVSFKVDSFNKIGIVGRTGAGKSTIITAFFRFIEADTGSIKIDGLDISKIGLKDLRENIAIIPQDPTLFIGTIRSNLDPFGLYTDEDIFEALRRVHLIKPNESSQSSVDESGAEENINQFKNLESPVTEGGNNLSQGQRQLICLARSLLKSPKLLLLDEATASIDYESDAQIQNTIREEFSETTILTIAHRLRSIVDYDKILVMDAGKAVEYDHPHTLLSNHNSIFYSMCANSGELEALLSIAENAYAEKFGITATSSNVASSSRTEEPAEPASKPAPVSAEPTAPVTPTLAPAAVVELTPKTEDSKTSADFPEAGPTDGDLAHTKSDLLSPRSTISKKSSRSSTKKKSSGKVSKNKKKKKHGRK
jgi:ABC-type multidrug transport system fused ATPase/permease subunit